MESYEEWIRELDGKVIKVNPELKHILHSLCLEGNDEEGERR
ncbi:hypothetical protein PV791_05480 [Priestia filamentosa]